MDKRLKNRQFGYFMPDKKPSVVKMQSYQQCSGYSVGIIYIEECNYPMVPGNVVNAYSYDFPVLMRGVPNLTADRVFNADVTLADDLIELGEYMIKKQGIRALCSACGFFGNFHSEVAAALDVPVAMSTLVMVPWIKTLLKPGQKIGMITADASSLSDNLYRNCFVDNPDILVIKDLRNEPEFSCLFDYRGEFDNDIVKKEVVNKALEFMACSDDIGAILFECSDLPPYAYAVQAAIQLPVFDFNTLIRFLHKATTQAPYCGWI